MPKGSLDYAGCDYLSGWACDADNYSLPLDVHLYREGPMDGSGIFLSSVVADLPGGSSVGTACGGNPNHAFRYVIPEVLKDGLSHWVYAYAVDIPGGINRPMLSGSPKNVTCPCPAINISLIPPAPVMEPEEDTVLLTWRVTNTGEKPIRLEVTKDCGGWDCHFQGDGDVLTIGYLDLLEFRDITLDVTPVHADRLRNISITITYDDVGGLPCIQAQSMTNSTYVGYYFVA